MRFFLLNVFCCISIIGEAQLPNAWYTKAEFVPTEIEAGTHYATGFSIGNKGYVATGRNFQGAAEKSLFEYDPVTDTWTRKTDFAGLGRNDAVAFTIGSKAYFGTGWDVANGRYFNDFWEYDQATDTWTEVAPFPGGERHEAVAFTIGSKGYIATGVDSLFDYKRDLWEYDPMANTWTQKASLPVFRNRAGAVGFSVGTKGYVGTGYDGTQSRFKDFYEYDQATNTWIMIADLPGVERADAIAFSIGYLGYVGTGRVLYPVATALDDFYEYDPTSHVWNQRSFVIGGMRTYGIGFSIGAKGYAGCGWDGIFNYKWDFQEYNPLTFTSVDDLNNVESEIIFPNPSYGNFKVDLSSFKTDLPNKIEIINELGAIVKQVNLNDDFRLQSQLNCSLKLSSGLYMIKFISENRITVAKFVVQ